MNNELKTNNHRGFPLIGKVLIIILALALAVNNFKNYHYPIFNKLKDFIIEKI